MSARFLLRFDDIGPAMDWRIWGEVEGLLRRREISPILAVVPDNRDSKLCREAPREDFWECVRRWQSWGWTIGMHGYQHRFVTSEAGIVGLHRRSEFAGLPRREQLAKLEKAAAIFARQGVRPEIWIAPAHSFDQTTVSLLPEIGIHQISDGLTVFPHADTNGVLWIPQQLWRFRPAPFGVWTVCCHANGWGERELSGLAASLDRYRSQIASVPEIAAKYRRRRSSGLDGLCAWSLRLLRSGRNGMLSLEEDLGCASRT